MPSCSVRLSAVLLPRPSAIRASMSCLTERSRLAWCTLSEIGREAGYSISMPGHLF